jgi:hypothetical protein
MRYTSRYRSYFWPAILILAGVIALLINTGQIPAGRFYLLFDLWPLILIVIGVELIIRRSVHGAAGDVAAALVVLVAVVGALAYVAAAPNPSTTHTLDSSKPIGNLEQASVEIDVGSATVTLTGGTAIGSDLYRAHLQYSGPKPEITVDRSGKVQISQSSRNVPFVPSRRLVIDLQVNSGIPWSINVNSGASTKTFDLSSLHVGSIQLNTGTSRDDITLGRPSGVVNVSINGGALTVHLHRPTGTAASVHVSGGAVNLNFDGHETHAVGSAEGTTETAPDMYHIEINGGACNVTMDTSGASS